MSEMLSDKCKQKKKKGIGREFWLDALFWESQAVLMYFVIRLLHKKDNKWISNSPLLYELFIFILRDYINMVLVSPALSPLFKGVPLAWVCS